MAKKIASKVEKRALEAERRPSEARWAYAELGCFGSKISKLMELVEQKIIETINKVEAAKKMASKVEKRALEVDRRPFEGRWAHVEIVVEEKHLRSTLREAKR